jgi:hypothetical protein
MGVERSVVRWYAQRQVILSEITSLESQLQQMSVPLPQVGGQADAAPDTKSAELLLQLAKAREKLSLLGPCPKPMMG